MVPNHTGQLRTREVSGRRRSSGLALGSIAAIGVALALLASCSSSEPSTSAPERPTTSVASDVATAVESAADRGAAFLAGELDAIDPIHLSIIDFLGRNWGIDSLSEAGDLAESAFADVVDNAPWPYTEFATPEETLALGRVVDASRRTPPTPAEVESLSPTARLLASALYCDEQPLTPEDLASWDEETNRGGYYTSHVVFSWWITKTLGCNDAAVDAAGQRAVDQMRREFTRRVERGPAFAIVDDLSIEQAAFLAQVGEFDALTPAWIEAVLAAQNDDGGWALTPVRGAPSHWHATLLAVWMLNQFTTNGEGVGWVQG